MPEVTTLQCYTTFTCIHRFNGPLSRTTWVNRYQKGKTNLNSTEARDSEWQWHQLGHVQVCTSLQTDNHTSTPPQSYFTGWMPFPAAQPTASKHWRHKHSAIQIWLLLLLLLLFKPADTLTFLELLRGSLDARFKDLSIGRAMESQAKPLATCAPVVECRGSFDVEQIIGDGTVQHNLEHTVSVHFYSTITTCMDLACVQQGIARGWRDDMPRRWQFDPKITADLRRPRTGP